VTERDRETHPRHREPQEEAAAEEAAASTHGGDGEDASATDAAATDAAATDAAATDAAETSEDSLEAARAEVDTYREHLQRLQAEFDNYRKRVLREQTSAVELAAQPVIRRLLEVLDDFDLALMHAQDRPDFDRFLHGVELVYAKLLDTLRTEGLEKIDALGKPFDPELHEALMQSGEGDGDPVVADVLRPGYTLKGRVLRPAGVRVERK
jgi:molecular chaperone GrpE